jgi:hypothetical protein
MQDTSSGSWYGHGRTWRREIPHPYHPYAPRLPYAPPYAPPYIPYAPHAHHHHRHHLQPYGYPPPAEYPMPEEAYPAPDDGGGQDQAMPAPDVTPAPDASQPTAAASGVIGGYRIPPRNALVQDPGPDRAGREVLPMSTGVAILPTQSAQITARPQRVAFRPERVFISAAGTSGGAADWVVNDIKIGNRSQFSQSGDVPGDMFATNAIDGFVSFETAQTAMDVVMVVTYIGLNESGVPFFASIVGTAAI